MNIVSTRTVLVLATAMIGDTTIEANATPMYTALERNAIYV